ncbi:hypothetical protein [Vibrio phage TCU_VP02_YC]
MGSFNTTCAITRTPIQEGGLARVFFLEMDAFATNYYGRQGLFKNIMMGCGCYPWDNFKIIGYPLLGKYADYNNYEFEDADMANMTLAAINKRYVPNRVAEGKTLEDYNEYHDYMEIDEISDMSQLQDMEHSGSLRVKGAHGNVTAVVKMAMHEEVYQMMLEGNVTEGWGDDAKTYSFADDLKRLTDKYSGSVSGFDALTEKQQKRMIDMRDELYAKADAGEINERTGEPYTREEADKSFNQMVEWLAEDRFELGDERAEWFAHSSHYRDMADLKDNQELVHKLAEAVVGAKWCARWMMCNNYEFAPVMTCGQDYDTASHASRLRKLADIIESKKNKYHYEEHVELDVVRSERVELSLSNLKERFADWYDEDEQEYQDLLSAIESVKEQSSFVYGDGSIFDKFVEEYDVLRDVEENTQIHFKK